MYVGRLEYVVGNVLVLAREHWMRTGEPPQPTQLAEVIRDVLPLLPLGSLK